MSRHSLIAHYGKKEAVIVQKKSITDDFIIYRKHLIVNSELSLMYISLKAIVFCHNFTLGIG